ncbi:hypothetical protein C0J52_02273 [Blattella germanica]|nr:hypothetical protein C0J52_02273 [Blattella germanica]
MVQKTETRDCASPVFQLREVCLQPEVPFFSLFKQLLEQEDGHVRRTYQFCFDVPSHDLGQSRQQLFTIVHLAW